MIADLIDESGHAIGRLVDGDKRVFTEDLFRIAARHGDLRTDVLEGLLVVQRLQVAAGGDSLIEALQFATRQSLFQHLAADKHQVHARLPVAHQISDHTDLFHQPERQRVCFVHQQQHPVTIRFLRLQEIHQRQSQFAFFQAAIWQVQLEKDVLQEGSARTEPSAGEHDYVKCIAKTSRQQLTQQGFPRARSPDQHSGTFGSSDTTRQRLMRVFGAGCGIIEFGAWSRRERSFVEPKEVFVHFSVLS